MQFLRTAFWVVIAVGLAFFCMANYVPVTVRLWGDMVMETKLPVLLIGAFLLGALPFWIMARATRWRLKRRLHSTEKALVVATAAAAPPPPPSPQPPAFPDAPTVSGGLPDPLAPITPSPAGPV